jgi:hypothetical protein
MAMVAAMRIHPVTPVEVTSVAAIRDTGNRNRA